MRHEVHIGCIDCGLHGLLMVSEDLFPRLVGADKETIISWEGCPECFPSGFKEEVKEAFSYVISSEGKCLHCGDHVDRIWKEIWYHGDSACGPNYCDRCGGPCTCGNADLYGCKACYGLNVPHCNACHRQGEEHTCLDH